VAQAVEQLGEVEIEVGEEGVHADDVGQRGAEVAAVFLDPGFERGALEVAQPHAEGLEGLQVLVRHRPDRHQAEVAREEHVGGALEELRHLALEDGEHLAMPFAEKRRRTPKSKNSNGLRPLRLLLELAQPGDLGVEALAPLGPGLRRSKRRK
jgi:hypothetical protein